MAHGSPSPTRMLMICEPLELETAIEPYPRLATVTDWIMSGISAPTEITYLQAGNQRTSEGIRGHQRARRGHAEGTQRARRGHSETITHSPSVAVGMRSMVPQRVTMAAMVVEKSATQKKEATSVIG